MLKIPEVAVANDVCLEASEVTVMKKYEHAD